VKGENMDEFEKISTGWFSGEYVKKDTIQIIEDG